MSDFSANNYVSGNYPRLNDPFGFESFMNEENGAPAPRKQPVVPPSTPVIAPPNTVVASAAVGGPEAVVDAEQTQRVNQAQMDINYLYLLAFVMASRERKAFKQIMNDGGYDAVSNSWDTGVSANFREAIVNNTKIDPKLKARILFIYDQQVKENPPVAEGSEWKFTDYEADPLSQAALLFDAEIFPALEKTNAAIPFDPQEKSVEVYERMCEGYREEHITGLGKERSDLYTERSELNVTTLIPEYEALNAEAIVSTCQPIDPDQVIFDSPEFKADLKFIVAVYDAMGRPIEGGEKVEALTYEEVLAGKTELAKLAQLLIKGRKGEEGGITPDEVKLLAGAVYSDPRVKNAEFPRTKYEQSNQNRIDIENELVTILSGESGESLLEATPPVELDKNVYIGTAVVKKLDANGVRTNPGAMVSISRAVPPQWNYPVTGGSMGWLPNARSYGALYYNYGMTSMSDEYDNDMYDDAFDNGQRYGGQIHLETQGTTPFGGDIIGDTFSVYGDLDWSEGTGGYSAGNAVDTTVGIYGGGRWIGYKGELGWLNTDYENPSADNRSGNYLHGGGRVTGYFGPFNLWYDERWWGGDGDIGLGQDVLEGEVRTRVGADIMIGPLGEQWRVSPYYGIPEWCFYTRESTSVLSTDTSASPSISSRYENMVKTPYNYIYGFDASSPEYTLPWVGRSRFTAGAEWSELDGYDPRSEYRAGAAFRGGKYRVDFRHLENEKQMVVPYNEDAMRFTYRIDPSNRFSNYTGFDMPISVYGEVGNRETEDTSGMMYGFGLRLEFGRRGRERVVGDPVSDVTDVKRKDNNGRKDRKVLIYKGDASSDLLHMVQWATIYGAGSRVEAKDGRVSRWMRKRARAAQKEILITNREFETIENGRGFAGILTLEGAQKIIVARGLEALGYDVRDSEGRISNKKLRAAIKEYSAKKYEEAGKSGKKSRFGSINKKLIGWINADLKAKYENPEEAAVPSNLIGATVDTELYGIRKDMGLTEQGINVILQDSLRTRISEGQNITVQCSGISSNDPVRQILGYVHTQVGEIQNVKIEHNRLGEPHVTGEIVGNDALLSKAEAKFAATAPEGLDFRSQLIMEIKAGVIGYATLAVLEVIAEEQGKTLDALVNEIVSQKAAPVAAKGPGVPGKPSGPPVSPEAPFAPAPDGASEQFGELPSEILGTPQLVNTQGQDFYNIEYQSYDDLGELVKPKYINWIARDGQETIKAVKKAPNSEEKEKLLMQILERDFQYANGVRAYITDKGNGDFEIKFKPMTGTVNVGYDLSGMSEGNMVELLKYRDELINKENILPGTAKYRELMEKKIEKLGGKKIEAPAADGSTVEYSSVAQMQTASEVHYAAYGKFVEIPNDIMKKLEGADERTVRSSVKIRLQTDFCFEKGVKVTITDEENGVFKFEIRERVNVDLSGLDKLSKEKMIELLKYRNDLIKKGIYPGSKEYREAIFSKINELGGAAPAEHSGSAAEVTVPSNLTYSGEVADKLFEKREEIGLSQEQREAYLLDPEGKLTLTPEQYKKAVNLGIIKQ